MILDLQNRHSRGSEIEKYSPPTGEGRIEETFVCCKYSQFLLGSDILSFRCLNFKKDWLLDQTFCSFRDLLF